MVPGTDAARTEIHPSAHTRAIRPATDGMGHQTESVSPDEMQRRYAQLLSKAKPHRGSLQAELAADGHSRKNACVISTCCRPASGEPQPGTFENFPGSWRL